MWWKPFLVLPVRNYLFISYKLTNYYVDLLDIWEYILCDSFSTQVETFSLWTKWVLRIFGFYTFVPTWVNFFDIVLFFYQKTTDKVGGQYACKSGASESKERLWSVHPRWIYQFNPFTKRWNLWSSPLLWHYRHFTRLRHHQEAGARVQVLASGPHFDLSRRSKAIFQEIPRFPR